MGNKIFVCNRDIEFYLNKYGFSNYSIGKGRLMLLELLCKAGAGSYNSHSEELFLNGFDLLKKDRTPNKRGLKFICSMVYSSSSNRPECFYLMKDNRKNTD